MTLLFVILIILASVILSLIVLVQNPKGGGLAGNIAATSLWVLNKLPMCWKRAPGSLQP